MSNERIVKTAEAVEDLRKALELWCMRDENAGSTLGVRSAASAAVAAVDTALFELNQIRRETVAQTQAYDDATMARVDALLAAPWPIPAPISAGAQLSAASIAANAAKASAPTSYPCGECGQAFPVDPSDPIESHGAYLDHLDEHDDAEDDERDKASEADQ